MSAAQLSLLGSYCGVDLIAYFYNLHSAQWAVWNARRLSEFQYYSADTDVSWVDLWGELDGRGLGYRTLQLGMAFIESGCCLGLLRWSAILGWIDRGRRSVVKSGDQDQRLSRSVRLAYQTVSGFTPLRRFVTLAPSINVMTYLLT